MESRLKKKAENVLVFGASGLLGKCLIDNYIKKKTIHVFLNKKKIRQKNLKFITNKKIGFLKDYINKNNIKVIINLAGLTNIELCERNKQLSYQSNYILPIKLAKLCKEVSIDYVFISTDNFKFNFKKLSENQNSKPINNYGIHKRKSENEILKIYSKSLIIRTNFYCIGGKKRKSFSDTIIQTLKSNNEIGLFKDVYYTPIYGKYLLKYMFNLIKKKKFGIFNICSNEKITKFIFGQKICKIFNLNKNFLKFAYLKKSKNLVKRPNNMSLNNYKISKTLKIKIPSINFQLREMKKDLEFFEKKLI